MFSRHTKKSDQSIELSIGQSGSGEATVRWTGSNGGRVLGSPDLGKSTLAETIAIEAKRKMPNLNVAVISVTGRFDYQLGFPYDYFSAVRHRDGLINYLEQDNREMQRLIEQMEALDTKNCRDVEGFQPSLLIVDEHESVEECLSKADCSTFARLLTMRINCGRKLERVTWSLTQSQVLDAVQTRTRSLEYTFLGRPQTKAICNALGLSDKYYEDYELTRGRMLKVLGGMSEVVKIRRET